jgi:hypothetical protein
MLSNEQSNSAAQRTNVPDRQVGSSPMSDEASPQRRDDQRIPWQQILFDDIFLLIMAGLVVPTLLYIVWGLWSLGNVPAFRP